MVHKLFRLTLICFLFSATATQAELIYQPPPDPEAEAPWTSAGSSLLEGIASLFDWLAAIESNDADSANEHFDNAISKLENSAASYGEVSETISEPREISLELLSEVQRQRITQTFEFYKLSLPQNETEAANLAKSESQRLVSRIIELRPQVVVSDVTAVHQVLEEVTRVLWLGTRTSELMSGLR